jgi:DNA modification methylase
MELDKVYNQDCIAGMGSLPADSVHLAFADPPFNIGYKYDVYKDKLAADEYVAWTKKWGAALVRTLKPTGSFWLAIGDDFAAELKLIFQRDLGLICRSWVIWYYTFGVNCKRKFSRSHTHLFHFVKDAKMFTFNRDAIRVPSARQIVYADSRANSKGRLPDDTWILRPQDAPESFTPDEDVWYVPRVCGTFSERAGWHGCQMPEQLLGRIIKVSSNPDDLVLDPFGGSGTTLVVAKKLGRHFVGFELSKNYVKQINSRLKQAQLGDSLSGPDEPKTTAPPTAEGKKISRSLRPQKIPAENDLGHLPNIDGGISDAFFAIRQGFPVDRVIADPGLNDAFVAKCAQLGLPGKDFDWNQRLMNLRKMGRLKVPTSLRTTFPLSTKAEFDRYKFACEIAIQYFEEANATLDHVLCDPKLARSFDDYVLSMLPDRPSSLKIRWFALRIRKQANRISAKAALLDHMIEKGTHSENPFEMKPANIPSEPGLYWLSAGSKALYVGETINLHDRLSIQFRQDSQFSFWGNSHRTLRLCFHADQSRAASLPEHQSRWISEWKPIGNYKLLATRQ